MPVGVFIPQFNPGGQGVLNDLGDPSQGSTTVPIVQYKIPIAFWPLMFLILGYVLLRWISGD